MITTDHALIRTADVDDVPHLLVIYRANPLRAMLLNRRREPEMPTADQLRETLTRKELRATPLYVIEDREGVIRGMCALRGHSMEAAYAECLLAMRDDADYDSPQSEAALAYLLNRAFNDLKLNKVVAHCLDSEPAWRAFLQGHGFEPTGVQREVVFSGGTYHDLESYDRFREPRPAP
jgi:RimJ/RimL family protein N-acetyltransferase